MHDNELVDENEQNNCTLNSVKFSMEETARRDGSSIENRINTIGTNGTNVNRSFTK